jgi:hypothetical protein
METKTKTAIIIAVCMVFAFGSIGSFVNLSGIANAYESADNNHKAGLTLVDIRDSYIGSQPYCKTQSC